MRHEEPDHMPRLLKGEDERWARPGKTLVSKIGGRWKDVVSRRLPGGKVGGGGY